jgi:CRISPR-associated protein Csm3
MNDDLPRLEAVLHIDYRLRALTGLHVGGSETGISIGGSDNPIIRDPLTRRPYIPGSSVKGKMRSLVERRYGKEQNRRIGQVYIHTCDHAEAYADCEVCPLFGIPAPQQRWFCLTRLRFPDAFLDEGSVADLEERDLDLPFTELKTEVAIDRATSAATPRNIERVPAGALFGPGRISLFHYAGDDLGRLNVLREGMSLLEADYLGGSGARGSGRVRFEDLACSSLVFPEAGGVIPGSLDRSFPTLVDFEAAIREVQALLGG